MKETIRGSVIALAFISLVIGSWSDANAASKPIGVMGGWKIYALSDDMTDQKSCIAELAAHSNIQVSPTEGIAISMRGRGGNKFFIVRENSNPPRESVNPSDGLGSESSDDYVIVPSDAAGIADGTIKRVRFEIFTVVGDVVDYDIDFTDGQKLMHRLSGVGCK